MDGPERSGTPACGHPSNGKWVYLVNEKDSTAIFFHSMKQPGPGTPADVTTLPDDYFGPGWASGIVMGTEGKAVYVSNRTHDSVTVLAIDPETGRLSFRQNLPTEGKQPRFLDLEPGEKRLVAANELTHTLTVFQIQDDGTGTGRKTDPGRIACVCGVEEIRSKKIFTWGSWAYSSRYRAKVERVKGVPS